MKVTFQVAAWLTDYSDVTPEELQTPIGAKRCQFTEQDMSHAGWTRVGIAEITLDVLDPRQLVDNKVAALREQASSIRAEATARVTKIESQIQQLLAIENSATGTPATGADGGGIPG